MNVAQRKLHLMAWVPLALLVVGLIALGLQRRPEAPVQDAPPRAEAGR